MDTTRQIDALLASPEPSIRHKVRVGVLGESESSRSIRSLRREIRASPRVAALLAGRASDGRLLRGRHVYQKWQGAHWVMAALADLGYPPGDRELVPIRDQLLDAWLAPDFFDEFDCPSKPKAYSRPGVPVMRGRHRRCASQQGNALYAIVTLGLADERTEGLVERLLYWHYDILGGLKVMAEAGFIHDERCGAALERVAAKQLPDGGFPAEARHYKTSKEIALGNDAVDWGGTSKRFANPWITADALSVLAASGRPN